MDTRYVPVLHSVSYAGAWPGQAVLSVEEFLDRACGLGFRAVALVAKRPHVSPLDYNGDARRRLRDRMAGSGLELSALMGYSDFTAGIDRPGIPSAEMNAAYIGELARLAADLGTTKVRIFTGYERDGVAYDTQYAEVVKGLRMAAQRAAEFGVTLLVQNHHDIACHHRQLAWLLDEAGEPNLKAAFDAWAPWLQGITGEALEDAVVEMGARIAFTTVADYQVQPRFRYDPQVVNFERRDTALLRAVAPGEGEVDYDAFFRGLEKAGYSGAVAYEMCAPLRGGGSLENLDRTAQAFLTVLETHNAHAGATTR
ncbi:MAG TPA: sugar phosphate isomerase/epimerase [Bryobacteraceae bacterium]|nr:sugar phosphate isomerase/epimerase [Bryobacteraceae bacterium]